MSKPAKLSRKEFLRLMAASLGAVAGGRLLAACSPSSAPQGTAPAYLTPQAAIAPATLPAPTATTAPLPTAAFTDTATPVQPTATSEPTVTIIPSASGVPAGVRRPEVIKFYPDAPSQLVRVHHGGAWDGDKLVPDALRQMLDAGITRLTGVNDAHQAWAALFSPTERIAIKVNTIMSSSYWTPVPLVMAVAQSLQDAGIPAEQIVIFDRDPSELRNAGFTLNKDGPGVRCTNTTGYSKGYKLVGIDAGLSEVLLGCDALINMPILKSHGNAGMTFSMKNHYGTFQRPTEFYHSGKGIQQRHCRTERPAGYQRPHAPDRGQPAQLRGSQLVDLVECPAGRLAPVQLRPGRRGCLRHAGIPEGGHPERAVTQDSQSPGDALDRQRRQTGGGHGRPGPLSGERAELVIISINFLIGVTIYLQITQSLIICLILGMMKTENLAFVF